MVDRQNINEKYIAYKSRAKRKNQFFDLTKYEFSRLWQLSCSYCGSEINTIGLDRVDNEKGYDLSNVVPCCSICNYMKRSDEIDDFKNHVVQIVKHSNFPKTTIHTRKSKLKYSAYKSDAKRRNLIFDIDKDMFMYIISKNCYYCGTIESMGIDRLNNSQGYIVENVVASCTTCNMMKRVLSPQEFYDHVLKIYNHMDWI
jgi:5-methylcytosine-specific restriction endonuclease McrA